MNEILKDLPLENPDPEALRSARMILAGVYEPVLPIDLSSQQLSLQQFRLPETVAYSPGIGY